MSPRATVDVDPDLVQPGWIALLIVLALAVATFVLWRSMNSQLRKIQLPRAERPDRRLAYDRRPSTSEAADDATDEAATDRGDADETPHDEAPADGTPPEEAPADEAEARSDKQD